MKQRINRSTINPNRRWAYCDVCDMKFHIKDLIEVKDKYNRLYGKIVCKRDYSPTNPQDRPLKLKEKLVSNTNIMRPQRPPVYSINPEDDRVPGKVEMGWAKANPISMTIDLFWNAPVDVGSSGIIGYSIMVSPASDAHYEILINNTQDAAPYYNDTTTIFNSYASYSVAAINSFGIGPYSDPFYWPFQIQEIDDTYRYLITGDYLSYIVTGDNNLIIVNL